MAGLSVDITHENDALQSGAERFDELLACSVSQSWTMLLADRGYNADDHIPIFGARHLRRESC
jgi:hypothetical protein